VNTEEFDAFAAAFLRSWNEADSANRRTGLAALLDQELVYADPHMPERIVGTLGYLNFSDIFRNKFPNLKFELLQSNYHHNFGLIRWRLTREDASVFSSGLFLCEMTDARKARLIVGFPS